MPIHLHTFMKATPIHLHIFTAVWEVVRDPKIFAICPFTEKVSNASQPLWLLRINHLRA